MADTQVDTAPAPEQPAPQSLDERLSAREAAEKALGDIRLDDDGELAVTRTEQPAEPADAPPADAPPADAPPAGAPPSAEEAAQAAANLEELKAQGPPQPDPDDTWEKRHKDASAYITKLRQNQTVLEKRIAYLEGRDDARKQDEAVVDLDILDVLSDPQEGVKWLYGIASEAVRAFIPTLSEYEARLAALETDLSIRSEVEVAMREHPDFADWAGRANEIVALAEQNGQALTIPQAVALAKKIAGKTGAVDPGTGRTPQGAPPTSDAGHRIPAQAAREQAARSQVAETSTLAGDPSEPVDRTNERMTAREAATQAIADVAAAAL